MPWATFRVRAKAQLRRHQLLLWLVLATMLVGITAFGEPLDLSLRALRNKVRAQPVSGEIVVAGIDDDSLDKFGSWPWNRARLAELTQRLFERGADRVFIDVYLPPLEAKGDARLGETLARYPGRVFVASGMSQHGSEEPRQVEPMPEVTRHAETVSDFKWVEFWNGVGSVPYRLDIEGRPRRAMEAVLADVDGEVGETFPIDYSYQLSTVPYVSAATLLQDKPTLDLTGKSVVVGTNSPVVGGMFNLLGHKGRVARAFVVALGAETLRHGRPIVLGWWPAWLLAAAASTGLLYASRRKIARAGAAAAFVAITAGPVALEDAGVVVDVAPAFLLMIAAMVASAWIRFGARKRSQGALNPVSGLPTAMSILHGDEADPGIVVAARVRHFIDIISALPADYERELVKQIVTRLSLGTAGAQLLHGDDGNFFWVARSSDSASLIDQFKALQLIFRTPIQVVDKSFDVDVAFGLDQETHMPLSHRLASSLAAAHAASQQGLGWKVHDPAAAGAKEWSLSLLGELDQAIANGQIWVAYQPKLDLTTRLFQGAEALVRWTHVSRGPISPAEFVEIADKHGRIGKITAFVLNEAAHLVKDARQWQPGFTVSVNISPSQLTSREIVEMVKTVLIRHDIPASSLILEVTESAALVEGQIAQDLLDELCAMGVGLSIDDYGTGMSTLEYMRRIPAGELKIDRSFAATLANSAADQAVVRSTIELAHALGMKVVVEGIETAETLFMLTAMGCDIGQGYHIGRPVDGTALLELIEPQKQKAINA